MEINRINSCVSQPNVCRCCLVASGTWDLTMSYTNNAGLQEVYCDILLQCFGITLSHLTDWNSSKSVCGSCVELLRSACDFRKQVLAAETQFVEYWRGATNLVKAEDELQSNLLGSSPTFSYDENRENTEVQKNLSNDRNSPRRSLRIRQGQKKIVKTKSKKETKIENDTDFDISISQLPSKNELSDEFNRDANEMITEIENLKGSKEVHKGETQFFEVLGQHPRQDIKQVSERKRVILTCGIVLKDTSACPFRHHKSWFQCFFCSQDFMEINLLRNHTLKVHSNIEDELGKIKRYPRSLQIDISELKCRQCDLSLSDVEVMTRHFESVHQKVIYKECIADYKVDASPYSCHICKREFHVFRTLTTHLNVHYANCICDVCGKSFLNSKRLKVHKRTHENGSYPCTECGKVLKTKTSKTNHMESAHSKRVMKCQICFMPMKHYNDRIKHMSEVHNITYKFKCPICNREYNIKHYLATHMRQTHGHKNKKCLECGMAFITNHGLKKHMLRHSGEKPYSCTVCSKSYVRSYTLREHMRVHEAEGRVLGNVSV